jgi:PAS domain S-box-containing protein
MTTSSPAAGPALEPAASAKSADILRTVARRTARATQHEFFAELARSLAQTMGVRYCYVAECLPERPQRAITLAFWRGDHWGTSYEYELAGTPSQQVLAGQGQIYTGNIQSLFPKDRDLAELKAVSFAGVAVRSAAGEVIGALAVLDVLPFREDQLPDLALLELFAARAGAEIERRRTSDALRLAEARLRQVIDLVPNFIYAKDLEDRFVLANKTVARAYGVYSPLELLGKTDDELAILKKEIVPSRPVDPRKSESGPLKQISEEQMIDAHGHLRVLQTVQIPFTPEKSGLPALLSVSTDITELRRSEERLRLLVAGTAGTTGEAFFRSLVRHLAAALGKANAVVGELRGTKVRTLAVWSNGRPLENFEYDLEGTPCADVIRVREVCVHPRRVSALFPSDHMLVEMGIESYLGAPLVGSSGEVLGVVAVFDREPVSDTSEFREIFTLFASRAGAELERQHIEEQRRQLQAQMLHVQKLESLGVLAGGIAHDFNNLLASILGNTSLAQMQLSSTSVATTYLAEIEKAAQRSAELVQQMLAYAGKGRFLVEELDFNVLVREMAGLLRTSISKKAQLELELEPRPLRVKIDGTQIRQVVMNLITNASDALGEGAGEIKLRTRLVAELPPAVKEAMGSPAGPAALLEVEDTGCGMDEKTRERLFDPFFTTKAKGRGLGLSALLGIVRSHKGAVLVETVVDAGSLFKVYLPALPPQEAEAQTASPQASQPAAAAPAGAFKKGGRILVVDDEDAVRQLASRILDRLGFEPMSAVDGESALEIYRNEGQSIRAIVLDMAMPKMNGRETLAELQKIDPDVKVVLSSGYGEASTTALAEEGKVLFLQKPYRPQDLDDRLRLLLS